MPLAGATWIMLVCTTPMVYGKCFSNVTPWGLQCDWMEDGRSEQIRRLRAECRGPAKGARSLADYIPKEDRLSSSSVYGQQRRLIVLCEDESDLACFASPHTHSYGVT